MGAQRVRWVAPTAIDRARLDARLLSGADFSARIESVEQAPGAQV